MDCEYLLVYGEGLLREDQNHIQFHATTPEGAEKNAETIISVIRKQAQRPQMFSATLYRQVKEWR
ncbi:MAG: hypothetical protein A3C70_00260 [Candidatus Zambryskibacteria bacterium RIFCSPHIGHO2_02_FULL_43_14]|uniref:Uncharacterized protein n=1 Tax=Candidatus Zambryskibacteria bacterium RIFCSPHIGHO2_02_FULL_43_14 TaxID=1802748 RepID=A0A1G2TF31_9BACT|nr:MAG: hypothetical protein A2829_03310 [Candidatus Zambryskibacteria bacterium RIFCSPHIGHO2_01_FULL_43_60]OHA95880.1 MAG: hypothetical protein A3C70_00260 [Candidatus Zambryskibacteria bacterium RIFCSPHIGHO2_02_FULL_43_14]OHB03417.1 MAG: hypothetical protein A3B03_02445 [Candidatus Zambryskibacteria bacterium RIFCSPLOWO2_01_FULL_42_41]